MENEKTDILMATCNGEKFLREQLDSILRQTHTDWRLLVHDDGSTDATRAILDEYAVKDPRIVVLDYPPMGGPLDNFMSLIARSDADYIAFADQDDVWMEDKMAVLVETMREQEIKYPGMPLVVYSDLEVVDRQLNTVSPSFWSMQAIHPEWLSRFADCGEMSPATGCAMMMNRRAKEVLPKATRYAQMHDSFICLNTLSKGGRLVSIERPLVRYRQHEGNVIGATAASSYTFLYRLVHIGWVIGQNRTYYRMLRELKYPGLLTFVMSKCRYRWRLKHG